MAFRNSPLFKKFKKELDILEGRLHVEDPYKRRGMGYDCKICCIGYKSIGEIQTHLSGEKHMKAVDKNGMLREMDKALKKVGSYNKPSSNNVQPDKKVKTNQKELPLLSIGPFLQSLDAVDSKIITGKNQPINNEHLPKRTVPKSPPPRQRPSRMSNHSRRGNRRSRSRSPRRRSRSPRPRSRSPRLSSRKRPAPSHDRCPSPKHHKSSHYDRRPHRHDNQRRFEERQPIRSRSDH